MVRRVGFGEDEKEEQPHKAHVGRRGRIFGIMPRVERAKAKSAVKKRGQQPQFTKRDGKPLIAQDNTPRGKRRVKWIIITFLSFWLAGWGYGIISAVDAYMNTSGGASVFLMVWIGGASVGWLLAVLLLLALLFGKEVTKEKP